MGSRRFIILCSEFPPEKYGGIAYWAKNLLETLTGNGHDAIVLTHLSKAHKRIGVRSTRSVRYISGHDWKKLHWLYRLPYLIREFATHKECVVIAATWDELQVVHRLKPFFNFRIYCSSHGTDVTKHVFPKSGKTIDKINRIFRSVDLFMPVSRSLDNLARSMYPALSCRSIVLGCNVNTDRFRPESDAAKRTGLRKRFGIDPECRLVITVGRMMPVKGFRHVIMALPAVRKVVPNVRYMIVAAPQEPEYLQIRHLVRELGLEETVVIQPPLSNDELPELLQAADLFVLTSEPVYCPFYQEEGLPRVIPEASACGLPVIVSTTGGLSEAVVEGETGHVVHLGDHDALVCRMTELLSDRERAAAMGARGRDHVLEHFSDRRMTETILSITGIDG